jgi:hypothetical protein
VVSAVVQNSMHRKTTCKKPATNFAAASSNGRFAPTPVLTCDLVVSGTPISVLWGHQTVEV